VTARRQLGTASDSLALVARLMALASQPGEDALATAIAGEAAALLRVPAAAVIAGSDCDGEARIASSREPIRAVPAAELGPIAALVASGEDHARLHGAEAALPVGDASHPCAILLRLSGETVRVLALTSSEDDVLDPATLTLGLAFAEAASAAFTHQATGLAHRRTAGQHAALARAAKTLNESLDLSTLLARICQEAATVTSADSAVVYRLTGDDALAVEAAHGLPPEHIGFRLAPGAGLAGKVIKADRPMMTENYGEVGQPSAESPWKGVKASVAVPVHWGGELRGVLAVAYWSPIRLTQQHLDGLEAFAELAAVAFQNASAHAGLAHAARTDPLTGCLNHAAVHEGLARRSSAPSARPAPPTRSGPRCAPPSSTNGSSAPTWVPRRRSPPRSRPRTRTRPTTRAPSPARPRPSVAAWGWTSRRGATCASARCFTTSARSPFRKRSSTSRDRSIPRSAR